MSRDPESAIEESLSHEERAVVALEQIGEALTVLAKLGSQVFDKLYPARVPTDATVTKIQSEEERARESLGDDGSKTLEEWTDLDAVGPRERELIKKKNGG